MPLVAGPIFFGEKVAKALLSCCVTPPLDACTYLGIDNGATPLKLSLYLDIIACMAHKEENDEFFTQAVSLFSTSQ